MHQTFREDDSIIDPEAPITLDLDPMESKLMQEARIQIHTLSPDIEFGGGTYSMSDVKKMTTKRAFLKMPMENRQCQVEPLEECRTRALIDECNCVPWEAMELLVGSLFKVIVF